MRLLKFVCLSTLCISSINTFSYKTHKFLGDLTEKYLIRYEPLLLEKIYGDFPQFSFTKGSVWPDKIKNKKEYLWTKKLHYIDIQKCLNNYSLNVINEECNNNCIFSALQNFTNTLHESKTKSNLLDELRFLMHFTQDFNQPLHLIGKERGGNSYKIILNMNGINKTTNLHYLWDSQIPEYYIKYYKNKEYFKQKQHILYNNVNNKVKNDNVNANLNYTELLLNILQKNIKIPCSKKTFKKYIVFEQYFDKTIIKELFKNYLEMIIFTLKYIYNHR